MSLKTSKLSEDEQGILVFEDLHGRGSEHIEKNSFLRPLTSAKERPQFLVSGRGYENLKFSCAISEYFCFHIVHAFFIFIKEDFTSGRNAD